MGPRKEGRKEGEESFVWGERERRKHVVREEGRGRGRKCLDGREEDVGGKETCVGKRREREKCEEVGLGSEW